MKRIIALLMALTMLLALCACGTSGGKTGTSGGNAETAGSSTSSDVFANIDMKSTEEQAVSDEYASKEILEETLAGLYGDDGLKKLTYEEIKAQIGVDCSVYFFDEDKSCGMYVWKVEGENAGSLSLAFDDNGKLKAAGAVNLTLKQE